MARPRSAVSIAFAHRGREFVRQSLAGSATRPRFGATDVNTYSGSLPGKSVPPQEGRATQKPPLMTRQIRQARPGFPRRSRPRPAAKGLTPSRKTSRSRPLSGDRLRPPRRMFVTRRQVTCRSHCRAGWRSSARRFYVGREGPIDSRTRHLHSQQIGSTGSRAHELVLTEEGFARLIPALHPRGPASELEREVCKVSRQRCVRSSEGKGREDPRRCRDKPPPPHPSVVDPSPPTAPPSHTLVAIAYDPHPNRIQVPTEPAPPPNLPVSRHVQPPVGRSSHSPHHATHKPPPLPPTHHQSDTPYPPPPPTSPY